MVCRRGEPGHVPVFYPVGEDVLERTASELQSIDPAIEAAETGHDILGNVPSE